MEKPIEDQPIVDSTPLDPNAILSAEFEYIVQTALQANEDRARVSNYYLVAAGAAVAAIIGAGFETITAGVYLGFGLLFAGLSAIGYLTLLQLARLRKAWRESVVAMNQLKDYYVARFPQLEMGKAFAWRAGTIPPADKPDSLAYLLALSVALIASASIAAAFSYLCLALGWSLPVQIAGTIVLFVLSGLWQMKKYRQWVR